MWNWSKEKKKGWDDQNSISMAQTQCSGLKMCPSLLAPCFRTELLLDTGQAQLLLPPTRSEIRVLIHNQEMHKSAIYVTIVFKKKNNEWRKNNELPTGNLWIPKALQFCKVSLWSGKTLLSYILCSAVQIWTIQLCMVKLDHLIRYAWHIVHVDHLGWQGFPAVNARPDLHPLGWVLLLATTVAWKRCFKLPSELPCRWIQPQRKKKVKH